MTKPCYGLKFERDRLHSNKTDTISSFEVFLVKRWNWKQEIIIAHLSGKLHKNQLSPHRNPQRKHSNFEFIEWLRQFGSFVSLRSQIKCKTVG